jgi:uncharacterized protein (TIGR00369 family)
MSLAALDRALRQVPFIDTLGIRVEESRTGHVVLRLPYDETVCNHAGALHTAALFAVGELAAAVVLGTHPGLAGFTHLQKSTKIKYFLPSSKDVTAHATIKEEMLASIQSGGSTIEMTVKILDGHGNDVAELACNFAFRVK